MSSYKELMRDELNHSYQPSDFRFISTDDIKGTNDFLGQEEAVEAIKQGLKIEEKGYNLYICSENYQRMDDVILKIVEKAAAAKKPGKALGYLYNFHHPSEPALIEVCMDTAMAFSNDLEELSAALLNDLPVMLDSGAVKDKQHRIIEEFEQLKASYLLEISNLAKDNQVQLKVTDEKIKFMPLTEDGKAMSLKQYESLSQEQQEIVNESIEQLQEMADEVVEQISKKEDEYYELYEEVKQEAVLREISGMMRKLKESYREYPKILDFLNDMAEDILDHIALLAISETESKDAQKDLMPWMTSNEKEKLVKRYAVNWITMPSGKGAPVINDMDQPYMNLSGKILVDADNNTINSDFSYIKGGLLHQANHGYLLLHMQNLLEKPGAWQSLKNMLRTGRIRIERNEETNLALVNALLPEAVEANVKIILIGSQDIYELLQNYDESFKDHFKIKVNLDEEITCTPEHIEKLAKILKKICRQEKLPAVTIDGLLKMVSYSSRKLGSVDKFHGDIEIFVDLLREAKLYNKKIVDSVCLDKVIRSREKNDRLLEKRLEDTILDATYLIDTEGKKIGQINGLAVYSIGELSCGRPIKITATVYRGRQGIVDIDGEAKLSGAIHTKGISIITGFLGYQFAQDFPLSLNCNICIEQNYASIDGDSASSAELYAVISSLAELPISQNLAVTGSMNQFGDIQPIGGVNEKIEGFYKICQLRGLQGNEGVIIPQQNTKDLLLSEEVIESVERGVFHIYEITDVWEGMTLLMGKEKEEIKKKTYEKLKKFSQ